MDSAPPLPRFVADAMLGGLTRWLRVLGLDVAHDPELGDRELVERAVAEGRIILTRDRRLVERRLARRHHLVAADSIDDQLREVVERFELTADPGRLFSRCLRCNTSTEPLDAGAVAGRVPAFVARTQTEFRYCPRCDKVYWGATHVERMRSRLESLGLLDRSC